MESHLSIKGLALNVKLGWTAEERTQNQIILVDIDITLPTPPEACHTDELSDAICYSAIASDLRISLNELEFRLIESLTKKIYDLVKSRLPTDAETVVHVTKHPKISGLTGGVRFSYGDKRK
jgi:dihydroneopterin aldolase